MKIKETVEKIGRWIRRPTGKASLWLILASIVLALLGASDLGNLTERAAANINSILFGIATNLLGIAITISFVQFFIDQQQEKDDRTEEARRILRQDRIMQELIEIYTVQYNQLTTPFDERKGFPAFDSTKLNLEFVFTDLRDLYQVSILVRDKIYCSAIVSFYESEQKLREYCSVSLRDIDYKYYPEIGELLLNFVRISTSFDVRNVILSFVPKSMDDQEMSSYISKLIGDNSTNWVELAHSGELGSNIMIPFVSLYDMLKAEGQLIVTYCEAVKKVSIS